MSCFSIALLLFYLAEAHFLCCKKPLKIIVSDA